MGEKLSREHFVLHVATKSPENKRKTLNENRRSLTYHKSPEIILLGKIKTKNTIRLELLAV